MSYVVSNWLSVHFKIASMSKDISVESLMSNLVDTVAENVPKRKSVSFFEGGNSPASTQLNRLFGRQQPIHSLLGGGKSADVLLWRNKKISASVLAGATAIWVLFEWLHYHFLTFVFFGLILVMLAQFLWTNASGLLKKSPADVPRLVLPEDIFINIGRTVGFELNRALQFIQDVSCGCSMKQFLIVVANLWVAAVIGSWCNFLTVLYISFVAAHTLPVLYDKYEDEVDDFVYKVLDQFQGHYRKMDSGLLSKNPRGMLSKGKKHE